MIEVSVTSNIDLTAHKSKIQAELAYSIGRATLMVLRRVKQDKLTGQVLNVQTGRLRRSITNSISSNGTGKIIGIVGTNVAYGRIHELGFRGAVNVKEHLRRTKTQKKLFTRGARVGQINVKQTLRDQKAKSPTILVSAHTRNVNFPERSFLRTALKDMQPVVLKDIQDSISRALR